MTDVVLGMGEVGETLFDLLEERGFDCVGIDSEPTRCRNYTENKIIETPEYLHVCLPGELSNFDITIEEWFKKIGNVKNIVVHSTVRPGTTRKIQCSSTVFSCKGGA